MNQKNTIVVFVLGILCVSTMSHAMLHVGRSMLPLVLRTPAMHLVTGGERVIGKHTSKTHKKEQLVEKPIVCKLAISVDGEVLEPHSLSSEKIKRLTNQQLFRRIVLQNAKHSYLLIRLLALVPLSCLGEIFLLGSCCPNGSEWPFFLGSTVVMGVPLYVWRTAAIVSEETDVLLEEKKRRDLGSES